MHDGDLPRKLRQGIAGCNARGGASPPDPEGSHPLDLSGA
jgi:hypothetical protein